MLSVLSPQHKNALSEQLFFPLCSGSFHVIVLQLLEHRRAHECPFSLTDQSNQERGGTCDSNSQVFYQSLSHAASLFFSYACRFPCQDLLPVPGCDFFPSYSTNVSEVNKDLMFTIFTMKECAGCFLEPRNNKRSENKL